MRRTAPLLFLVFCVCTADSLFADVVILKAGPTEIAGNTTGTGREITIGTPDGTRSIPIDQLFSIRFGQAQIFHSDLNLPAPAPAQVTLQDIELPAGTVITVRTIDAIDSKTGDTFREYAASLDDSVVVNQVTVAPAKANAFVKIGGIKQAGKLKGSTTLSLHLIALTINGRRIELETDDVVSASSGKGKDTVRDGAIGAVGGCGIGAVAGGTIGCGVGGAIGSAAGVTVSVLRGKAVQIPPETRLTFRTSRAVVVPVVATLAVNGVSGSPEEQLAEALRRGEAHMKANEPAEALKDYRAAAEITLRMSSIRPHKAITNPGGWWSGRMFA
jgi:hypothetical protein